MTHKRIRSKSEERGLSYLKNTDLSVYSVGISTAGWAEIEMAKMLPNRKIIATTIDSKGSKFTQDLITQNNLSDQISIKIEDVSHPLPYKHGSFDFIYARLVLHYLPKEKLDHTLSSLYGILKPGGSLYAAVLSDQYSILCEANTTFDPVTRLTAMITEKGSYTRYFHTKKTLKHHLEKARFSFGPITALEENLCYDYERTCQADTSASLLDVLAKKES